MQKNTQQEQKDGILKSLAIVGFVGLIIVISWLGIQLVQTLPSAINSLASLADSVYNYEPVELTTVSNKSIANVDESFIISWSIPKQTGTFAFSYACAAGLAVDIRTADGIKSINCDTNYNLGNVSSVDIIATSERERFTDLAYNIDFIATDKTEPTGSGSGIVSIVNASIDDSAVVVEEETPDEVAVATTTPEVPVTTPTTPTAPTTPTTPTKPITPPAPTYTQEYVYSVPVSNPNGYTDLQARHLGTGSIVNGKFVPSTTIDNDAEGAVRFEVKNIGTKTSSAWSYSAKLPNGETYTAPMQVPLKPQERMTISIGFTMPDSTGKKNYTVAVSITGDNKLTNNSFTSNVQVSD
jgi:hypothetical protein